MQPRAGLIEPPQGVIQNPVYARRLVQRLGIRERMPLPVMAPEVQPIVILDDVRPVAADLSDVIPWAGGANVAPGAGVYCWWEMVNLHPDWICVVDRIYMTNRDAGGGAYRFILGWNTLVPHGAPIGRTTRDSRMPLLTNVGNFPPTMFAGVHADNPLGGVLNIIADLQPSIATSERIVWEEPIILWGDGAAPRLSLAVAQPNIGATVTFSGRLIQKNG